MKTKLIIFIFVCIISITNEIFSQCIDPEPYISPENTAVCGYTHQLSVQNVQGSGVWTVFSDGEPLEMDPMPHFFPDDSSPDAIVINTRFGTKKIIKD